jgi:UDP-N-acetylmuramoyl-tripeptide--D-alanyl-D-alanine ligase
VIPLSLGHIAATTQGTLVGADPNVVVTGTVEFDSRRAGPGGLFVAFAGSAVDGHDYAQAAIERGAVAVIGTRPLDVPTIVVADPLEAIARLAADVIRRLTDITVVGVTGSSGKTSTKDLIAHVLRGRGAVVAPPGSFNNELGHPWTVLRADADTRFLVLEKGARGVGHIRQLTQIAPPSIGVVLNVGSAHLGEFGSREQIAVAKRELVEALPADGVAVLNFDDPNTRAMSTHTAGRVVGVGLGEDATVRATNVTIDIAGRAAFTIEWGGERAEVRLGLHGEHYIANALSAAAVGFECGMSLPEVVERLGTARPASPHRMDVRERADGTTVIDDSYNANPESMSAGLQSLAAIAAGSQPTRRSWAVLGPMAELGPDSPAQHHAIGALVARLGIHRLLALGEPAAAYCTGAQLAGMPAERVHCMLDVDAALRYLDEHLAAGDVVLVKASRAARLERVVEALNTRVVGA